MCCSKMSWTATLERGRSATPRVAIGALLAALAVTGFHWAVYQEDRLILPDEERTQLREVVLVLCQRRRPRRSGGGPDRCPCAGLAADGERRRFVERQGGRGGSWSLRR